MKMMLAIALAASMLAIGCVPAGQVSLDGSDFVLVRFTVNGVDESLEPGTTLRLSFADGSVGVHAGCNHIGGSYSIRDGRLVVSDMYTTEMGCPGNLHAQDERITEFLASNPRIGVEGDSLTLESTDITATFRLREAVEPDQPLTDTTWVLSGIIAGDSVSSVPAGIESILQLGADGQLSVQPGCNTGSGRYTLEDGMITFGPIALTRMACPGDRGNVEEAVLAVLGGEASYTIEGGTLTLMSGGHGLQYTSG
jgi:heat shock protein HslJ